MSEHPEVEGQRQERAPDYRAVFRALRELTTCHTLITPYLQAAWKILLTDLPQKIRENMAAASDFFRRRPSNQHHQSSGSRAPGHPVSPPPQQSSIPLATVGHGESLPSLGLPSLGGANGPLEAGPRPPEGRGPTSPKVRGSNFGPVRSD